MQGGCRFRPTCSQYAKEAYKKHNVLKATGLTLYRLARCNPWFKIQNHYDLSLQLFLNTEFQSFLYFCPPCIFLLNLET